MVVVKAVLFDFGGTLCTYEQIELSQRRVAAMFARTIGHPDEGDVLEAWRAGLGAAFRRVVDKDFYLHVDIMRSALREGAASLGRECPEAEIERLQDVFESDLLASLTPRPGMETTLRALRERGLHLGGVSNADVHQFEAMVDTLELRELFDSFLCSEEARSCKPHEGIFLQALEQASCRPEEAVFVGDTPNADIAGAEAVGMRAILIHEDTDVPFDRGDTAHVQTSIRHLSELLDLI